MRHGRRPGVVPGACRFKIAFTTYDAVMSAMSRVKDAERPYLGDCCGYWHMTRTTEAEYAQQIARSGNLDSYARGRFDLTGPEYVEWLEAQDEDQQADPAASGREPGGDAGRPRATPLERGSSSRPAPSPAEVARRVQGRRRA